MGAKIEPIVVEVNGEVAAPIETVFDVFRPIDLTTIMKGYGPLPAVAGIEDQTGDWDAIGQSRVIRLADGHAMLETLTRVERPKGFEYTITNLTSGLRLLVRRFHGRWRFATGAGGDPAATRAEWRYVFEPRARLTRGLAWLILRRFWRPTMQAALAEATRQAEAAAPGMQRASPREGNVRQQGGSGHA